LLLVLMEKNLEHKRRVPKPPAVTGAMGGGRKKVPFVRSIKKVAILEPLNVVYMRTIGRRVKNLHEDRRAGSVVQESSGRFQGETYRGKRGEIQYEAN